MNNITQNFNSKLNNMVKIVNNIHDLINSMKKEDPDMHVEGNYGNFQLNNEEYNDFLNKKISNLLWAMNLTENNPNVCEIGFNTGFSSSMMMMGLYNKNPNFYIFDYNEHKYVKPCLELFKSNFNHKINNFKFIEGDSIITLPNFINENQNLMRTFDFIHIDGGHSEECIKNDLKNCDNLIKRGGIIIIDDTNYSHINNEVDFYINNYNYVELFFLDISKFMHPHRIIQKK